MKIPPQLNVASLLCHYAFGHGHHWCLKYLAGIAIMIVGVLIAKLGGTIHAFHFHYFADVVGYGVHGLGAVPFIEWVVHFFAQERGREMEWPQLLDSEEEGID